MMDAAQLATEIMKKVTSEGFAPTDQNAALFKAIAEAVVEHIAANATVSGSSVS